MGANETDRRGSASELRLADVERHLIKALESACHRHRVAVWFGKEVGHSFVEVQDRTTQFVFGMEPIV